MPIDQSLVGREFPPTAPVEVTEEHVREFVEATGGEYAGQAPPTFPIVLAFDAMFGFLDAEQIDLFRIVHGDQKFGYERPVAPGDVLTATLTVDVAPPDRWRRHHRHHQRGHATPTVHWSAPPPRPWCTAGVTHEQPSWRPRPTGSRAPTWSRYAGASGDLNPIHQDERVATLRRAARASSPTACSRWRWPPGPSTTGPAPGPGRRARLQVHQARSSCPTTTTASRSRSPARSSDADDGLATVALIVTCGDEKVLGVPKAVVRA